VITRFAPSPTGPLHLGHAYSALVAYNLASEAGGRFRLRIEDIDRSRARAHWEDQIYEDLAWLGLQWETPVLRQSDRLPAYRQTLDTLWQRGLLFACSCNRADIRAAASAPQEGATSIGPEGIVYPGTCRIRKRSDALPMPPTDTAVRLDIAAALAEVGAPAFKEMIAPNIPEMTVEEVTNGIGDVVLARRDMGTSYHLSVVLDDAHEGITDVVRGEDLFEATFIHVILQRLLGLPTPRYHHHRLIRDETGKRLAKRDDARAVRLYRDNGQTPEDIRRMVGL